MKHKLWIVCVDVCVSLQAQLSRHELSEVVERRRGSEQNHGEQDLHGVNSLPAVGRLITRRRWATVRVHAVD